MPRIFPILLLSTISLVSPSLLAAQAGTFKGTVVDAEGNPLSDVLITITTKDLSSYRKDVTTNKRGDFRFRFQPQQLDYTFDLLFEKPGYASFTQPVAVSALEEADNEFMMEESDVQVVQERGDLQAVLSGSSNLAIEAFNAGVTAERAGDLEAAQQRFEEAIEIDPDLAPAHLARAQVLLDRRDYESALAAADRALELDASPADGLRIKYQSLRALGRHEEAETVSESLAAAEDAKSTALRVYNEGGQAFQAGDRETALAKFREAAEADPALIDAHHAIATLELAAGNHEAAAVSAEQALALGSSDVATLRVLYDAYDALGRTEELTEIAPRLAAVDPDYGAPKLLEQAAEAWNGGQTERAVSLSRQALAMDPSLAKAHYFLGLDHLSKGENEEAKAALGKFLELAPDDPEAPTAKEMLSYLE